MCYDKQSTSNNSMKRYVIICGGISEVIRKRRLKLSGHCFRQHQDPVCELVLWEPKHGTRKRGCPEKTYIDILKSDTGLASRDEIATCMMERGVWRKIVSRCSTMH